MTTPTTIGRGNKKLPNHFSITSIYLSGLRVDNTYESIQWAKKSHQEFIFLKLDLSEAYDRVDWAFMFQVMINIGMSSTYIKMIVMLFRDAIIFVNINNQVLEPFELYGGFCQGCPLTPDLFIIMTIFLNIEVKHAIKIGNLRSNTLLQGNSQQLISQYVDDTSFTVKAEETNIDYFVGIPYKCGVLVWLRTTIETGGKIPMKMGHYWRFIKTSKHTFWSSIGITKRRPISSN
jgi:hypothetical protein